MLVKTTIWLDEQELEDLRNRSWQDYLSMSQIIRLALRKAGAIRTTDVIRPNKK